VWIIGTEYFIPFTARGYHVNIYMISYSYKREKLRVKIPMIYDTEF
jgi:hypothetical protein